MRTPPCEVNAGMLHRTQIAWRAGRRRL